MSPGPKLFSADEDPRLWMEAGDPQEIQEGSLAVLSWHWMPGKKLADFVPKNRWAAAALDEIGISDPAAAANYTNTREDWSRLGAILRAPHQLF